MLTRLGITGKLDASSNKPGGPAAPLLQRLRQRAAALKQEIDALYLAYRDPRTPWRARIFTALVLAYAFSPIDLIPDFVPILGYLDDLILIPLGIKIALAMIPAEVMRDSRAQARLRAGQPRPVSRAAALAIVLIWLAVVAALAVWAARRF